MSKASPNGVAIDAVTSLEPWLVPERVVGTCLFAHKQGPEVPLCLIHVVRPAAKLKILGRGRAAVSKRDDVMELEEAALFAPSCVSDECALPFIPPPDLAPDVGGHVA